MEKFQNSIFRVFVDLFDVDYLKPWIKKVGSGAGSCCVVEIDKKKYYLTCHHVVDRAHKIKVADIEEKVLYSSMFMDLALLSCNNKNAEAIPIGSATSGAAIRVIGFPFDLRGMAQTRGVITRLTKIRWFWGKTLSFQIDAEMMGGNSGGPILNEKNEVCGITFGHIAWRHSVLKFAVPYFIIIHFCNMWKSGQPMHYKVPTFNWQITDEYMPRKEPVVVNRQHNVDSIENITILRDGQITIGDFLKYLGLPPSGSELISFHYLIPFVTGDTVKLGKKKWPLRKLYLDMKEEPEYLLYGDFIFVPLSTASSIQLVRNGNQNWNHNNIFSPQVPRGPKGQYLVYISHCRLSKYRGKILKIYWEDLKKMLVKLEKPVEIPIFNDTWTLWIHPSDQKTMAYIFGETVTK
jgi:hypothetical protein